MDSYLIIVIVLLALAAMDLTVGVANDAVNFLNSSLGSKAASFRTVIIIAALGVLAGVTLSSGMMEIARKGIFNPSLFTMPELLVIFVAVMFVDILLLDLFNTFGLPTSTTVSIVFGLFGSALAMAFIKVGGSVDSFGELFYYDNFSKVFLYIDGANVFKIISAIFLSIVIAFVFGALVQFLTRMLFTFDFKLRLRRFGSIWGGLALTFLTFFILLKGAKGASFITEETSEWIKGNLGSIFVYSFALWTIVLQLIQWFTKINILKIIVLTGTFALALAFAANDLVNFIGAPLAGLNAYQYAISTGDPLNAPMTALAKEVKAETWMLLVAGAIMVATLFLSKKARSVTRTEISLGKQEEGGHERFESNVVARILVRIVLILHKTLKSILPDAAINFIHKRFDNSNYKPEKGIDGETPAFDLLRASVILMVASALISFATSLKLPLSTTYVTFIVAMAAALPDKAWGRESAVYRVSGVVTVIGGWFFTAISAMLTAMAICIIIYYGEIYAVIAFLALVIFVMARTHFVHKKREEEHAFREKRELESDAPESVIKHYFHNIGIFIGSLSDILKNNFQGLIDSDLPALKQTFKRTKTLNKQVKNLVADILSMMKFAPDQELDDGYVYARSLASLQEIADRLRDLVAEIYNYVDNNHHELTGEQIDEIKEISSLFDAIAIEAAKIIENKSFENLPKLAQTHDKLKTRANKLGRSQLKRVKKAQTKKSRSILYLNMLFETDSIAGILVKIADTCKEVDEAVRAYSANTDPKDIEN